MAPSAFYFKKDDQYMLLHEGPAAGSKTSFEVVIDIHENKCEPAVSGPPSKAPGKIEERFKSLNQALDTKDKSAVKIQKVPSILLNNGFEKYYTPKKVSIGPFHHSDKNLKKTEDLKLKFARLFIRSHGLENDEKFPQKLLVKIEKDIQSLRNYYEAEATKHLDDDDLAWMFLVDGCTVLCCIYYGAGRLGKRFSAELEAKVGHGLKSLKEDLLLLENQLPYEVLRLIMSCLEEEGAPNKIKEAKKAIDKFLFETIKASEEKYVEYQDRDENPIHLLDLLRKRLLHPAKKDQNSCSSIQQIMKKVGKFVTDPLGKFKDFIECIGMAFEKSSHNLHFFRNIEELKAVGIRFRASNSSRLTSISFNLGTLKLPSIRIDESTVSRFLNLIAYEMCPNSDHNFEICSFVVFLDAFIDREQDVKLLRDNHILQNALGSDEEVAKLFNVISTHLMSDPTKYEKVKTAIQKRYENKVVTWMAQFNRQHFQNPWTVIAFLAASIVVISTIIQTVYTILGFYADK